MSRDNRRLIARLASIDGRLAQIMTEQADLLSQRARLWSDMAGENQTIDLRTGARERSLPDPAPIANVTELDQRRAQQVLRGNEIRRRTR